MASGPPLKKIDYGPNLENEGRLRRNKNRPFLKRQTMKPTIDWGIANLRQLNPVKGCRRGCSYCYARKFWHRFFEKKLRHKFDEPHFYPDVLSIPDRIKKQTTFFVGSMSDPQYYKENWMRLIIDMFNRNRSHTFMMLTKNYACSYPWYTFPKNVLLGLTLTCDQSFDEQWLATNRTKLSYHSRNFLSIEPLLGSLQVKISASTFEKVIVGGMTGHGAIRPKREWIESVKRNVPEHLIHWKTSKEYPEGWWL